MATTLNSIGLGKSQLSPCSVMSSLYDTGQPLQSRPPSRGACIVVTGLTKLLFLTTYVSLRLVMGEKSSQHWCWTPEVCRSSIPSRPSDLNFPIDKTTQQHCRSTTCSPSGCMRQNRSSPPMLVHVTHVLWFLELQQPPEIAVNVQGMF